jgi:hypothetical protein
MKRGVRSALLRLPGGVGYRLAGALHIRKPLVLQASNAQTQPQAAGPVLAAGTAPADRSSRRNGSSGGPLEVELEGRSKRLRVRAAGDIWSDDFREELARDRHFEASLAWRELVILIFIAAVLAARTLLG